MHVLESLGLQPVLFRGLFLLSIGALNPRAVKKRHTPAGSNAQPRQSKLKIGNGGVGPRLPVFHLYP